MDPFLTRQTASEVGTNQNLISSRNVSEIGANKDPFSSRTVVEIEANQDPFSSRSFSEIGGANRDPFSSRNVSEIGGANRDPFSSRNISEIGGTNRDPFSSRNILDQEMPEPVRAIDRKFGNSDLRESTSNFCRNVADRESVFGQRAESAIQSEPPNFGRTMEIESNLGNRIEAQTKFAPAAREAFSDYGRQRMEREFPISGIGNFGRNIERESDFGQRTEQPHGQQSDFVQRVDRGSTLDQISGQQSFGREAISGRQGVFEPVVGPVVSARGSESSTNDFRGRGNESAVFGSGREGPTNFSRDQSFVAGGQKIETVELEKTRFGQTRTAEFGGQRPTSGFGKDSELLPPPKIVPKPNPEVLGASKIGGQVATGFSRSGIFGREKVGASSNFGQEATRDSNFPPSDKIAPQNLGVPPPSLERSRVPGIWNTGPALGGNKGLGPGMPRPEAAADPAFQVKGLPLPARSALSQEQPKRQASENDKGNKQINNYKFIFLTFFSPSKLVLITYLSNH